MLPPRLRDAPTNLSGARATPPPLADFPAPLPPGREPARQGHPFPPAGRDFPVRLGSPRLPPLPHPCRRSPGGPGPGGDSGSRAAQARLTHGALRPEASAGGSAHRVRGRRRARGECREVGKGGGRQQAPPRPRVDGGSLPLVRRRPAGARTGGNASEEKGKAWG